MKNALLAFVNSNVRIQKCCVMAHVSMFRRTVRTVGRVIPHVYRVNLVWRAPVNVLRGVLTATVTPQMVVNPQLNVAADQVKDALVGAGNPKTATKGFAKMVSKSVMLPGVSGAHVQEAYIRRL